MQYNNYAAAALDVNNIGASGPVFHTDAEREFFELLSNNPTVRLAIQTILMRYAYTITFEALPAAESTDRLLELKGAQFAVRFLIDLFSTEDKDRLLQMTADELVSEGSKRNRTYG